MAYCDLNTGMVLCAQSRLKLPQEQLDQLALYAAELLNGDFGLDAPIQSSILVQGDTINVSLRSHLQPAEALSCDCALDIDLPLFFQMAQQSLFDISALALK